jgi:hypothetical protein
MIINNYRIEAVKKKFSNGEHKKSTLLELRLIADSILRQPSTVLSRKILVKLKKNLSNVITSTLTILKINLVSLKS